MSRLPRPPIPVAVKLTAALLNLGVSAWLTKLTVDHAISHRQAGRHLEFFLEVLADKRGCAISDLQLDHDPALQNREKLVELSTGGRYRVIVVPKDAKVLRYWPDANDPEHLFWRPHGTQFAGSHDVKTRLRGDHGQLSDNALAKKERKRLRKLNPNRRRAKIPQRKNPWPTGRKIQNRKRP